MYIMSHHPQSRGLSLAVPNPKWQADTFSLGGEIEQQIKDILENSTAPCYCDRKWPLGTNRDDGRGSDTSAPGSCLVPGLAHFSGWLLAQVTPRVLF